MQAMPTRLLRIRTSLIKPYVINVSIEDTGSGIDAASRDRIFRALFTTKASGMGMGLPICHSIIESHNGQSGRRLRPRRVRSSNSNCRRLRIEH